ncbi:hypothetical protein [Sinomonas atrocyanea]|uniref:hypothetical protein n=1 Tax=Sinomonas atrocyanea TaxID=37927 RepID=UPI0008364C24|nr:hypothetical protein [Sinomonas atrocyanea]
MSTQQPGHLIEIRVESRRNMEYELEQAVRTLRERAEQIKDRGILVTRRSPQDFTIELHPDVPYGLTKELQNW